MRTNKDTKKVLIQYIILKIFFDECGLKGLKHCEPVSFQTKPTRIFEHFPN